MPCRLLNFFKVNVFKKNLSEILSECQTVWIQIRPDILSGLIWVQTICTVYQQTALTGEELRNIKYVVNFYNFYCLTDYGCLDKRD